MSQSLNLRPGEGHCEFVDRLPKELRALVHDYGLSVVVAFYNSGIRRPGAIRTLIRAVHLGAREPGNKQNASAKHRSAGKILGHLDVWLLGRGVDVSAEQVIRAIRDGGGTVLPKCGPPTEMTEASMNAVSGFNVRCTRAEKHQRRLQAAIGAGDRALWGDF